MEKEQDKLTPDMFEISIENCGNAPIYHYTTASGIKSIIESEEFWVTKADFLNDPQEFVYVKQVLWEACLRYYTTEVIANDHYKAILKELEQMSIEHNEDNTILSGSYVLSFSLEQDNLLLWSEYSAFMGYNLELSHEELVSAIGKKGQLQFEGKVIYDKEIQIERLLQSMEAWEMEARKEKVTEEERTEAFHMWFAVACYVYSNFFKQQCFKGENEYRFVFKPFHENQKHEKIKTYPLYFREKENALIPFIKVSFAVKDKTDIIKSVMVGPKNNIDLSVKGLEQYFIYNHMNIPVYRSKITLRY